MSEEYDLNDLAEHPQNHGMSVGAKLGSCNEASRVSRPMAIDSRSDFDASQWTLIAPGSFVPSGRSYPTIPPGFYRPQGTDDGRVYAEVLPLKADTLSVLPGSCNEQVLTGIRKFWGSRELYRTYGLNYKRGILFYGPPGAGKTANVTLLCKELIEQYNGAVFICSDTGLLTKLLHKHRKIENDRPLIVVMEDLDEIIQHNGEHDILSLLDGEAQIDNVVYLASTNYPDRLGARIVNRPSRFDERIFVDMPSAETRRAYLDSVTERNPLAEAELSRWIIETKGMSIAHLRELVVAVRCLGRSYEETIDRLKSMAVKPRFKEGLGKEMGIGIAS